MWKKWSGTIICKICKTFVWNKNEKFARMIHNENCKSYLDWWFAKTVVQKDNLQKKIARINNLQNLPKIYQEEIYMITTNVCSHDLSYINFPSFRLENLFSFVVKRMEIIYHIWDTNSERHKSLVSDKKGTAVKACRRNGKHHWINDPNIKTNIIQKDNIRSKLSKTHYTFISLNYHQQKTKWAIWSSEEANCVICVSEQALELTWISAARWAKQGPCEPS